MTSNITIPLETINDIVILRIPKSESLKLPSRGIVMVKGTINTIPFKTVFEPDGKGSHWFVVDKELLNNIDVQIGDNVTLAIEPSKEWIEPDIPTDIQKALDKSTKAHEIWNSTTPIARWDWIRWIRGTNNPETRKHRIEVAMSKMNKGEKRPCCFNRNICTVPEVSKNGVLLSSV